MTDPSRLSKPETDVRFVLCEACGSEGRIYCGQYDDERDCGPCGVCKGTGLMEIEVEPIEMDDLA